MADPSPPTNPHLTTKPSDTPLNVQLHPLVLLTISDYITRHISRQQTQPIVGSIIGQQNGRTVTLEHAYEVKTSLTDNGSIALDAEWFNDRLAQYREVHTAPALDLVAVFMMGATTGPEAEHANVVKQVQLLSGIEGVMMVLFHAETVEQLAGGKLPISLYESVSEQGEAGGEAEIKFRELSFEVETGEAEMIAVDFVATGAGNATAVPKGSAAGSGSVGEASSSKDKSAAKGKGKGKESDKDDSTSDVLSPEDEELIASLTAKANAIKMLNQRLHLIRKYLESLPPSYLTDSNDTSPPPDDTNYTLLRSINAMLSRLPLLAPPTPSLHAPTPLPESTPPASKDHQDVHLTTLLASLTRSVSEAQSLGQKFHVMSREKNARDRNNRSLLNDRSGSGRFGDELGGLMMSGGGGGDGSGF